MTTRFIECADDATLAARVAAIDAAYFQAMRALRKRTGGQPIDTIVDREGYEVGIPAQAITTTCSQVIAKAGTAGGLIVCRRIERRLHNLGLVDLSDAVLRSALRLVWRNYLNTLAIEDDTGTPDDAGIETTPVLTRT